MKELSITLCFRPVPARRGESYSVASLLTYAGHRVNQVEDGLLKQNHCDVVLIMENSNWFPIIVKQLLDKPKQERPLIVLWHWEPLPPPTVSGQSAPRLHLREIVKIILHDSRITDVYSNSRRIRQLAQRGFFDILVVSSQRWSEYLNEIGIDSHWVPIGYEHGDGSPMCFERDIEVLFLGTLDVPRRKRIVKKLRKKNVNLLTSGSWFDPSCWGESRTSLINRSKIFLNIQRQPAEIAGHRLILGMANKSLVISEPIGNSNPFVSGKHYISACVNQMPEVINYYLDHDNERDSIVDEAYQFITQELTMKQSVTNILDLIEKYNNESSSCVEHTPVNKKTTPDRDKS